jgi:hypothetical protein
MVIFKKTALIASLALVSFAQQASASATLTFGDVRLGVQDLGALGGNGVGISFAGVGDAIMPGCLCEGWGASYGSVYGYSGNANGGNVNVSALGFTSTATTAVSSVRVGSSLSITQAYAPSASAGLFKNTVTLTNTGSSSIADVRYARAMDWDIPPTTFSEYVTINRGTSSNLLFSNDNGFATPNPLVNPDDRSSGTRNVSFVDSGPNDHGAFFTFGFGALAAGESKTFNIFYGATASESAALSALSTVGAEVFSLGQSGSGGQLTGSPATFIFGFSGVGGTPVIPAVPEPETYAMLLAGLGVLGAAARRKKAQA